MTDTTDQPATPANFAALTTVAEQMLSEALGRPIRFTQVERLSEPERRNLLLRCHSASTNAGPASYILKQVIAEVYNPEDAESWDTQRFFSDWVGSQFLSALGSEAKHSPRFYGGHRELGFIVLEDLGPHRSLVEPLLHEDAASATQALLRYSTRLGQLHADTVNGFEAFAQLLRTVNPVGRGAGPTPFELEKRVQEVQTQLEQLGLAVELKLQSELQTIVSTVVNPGPFWAYIHGDPCPDNVFNQAAELRLIDFEFGRFGYALIDAVYGRMFFPTCWCANRLPPALITELENVYRAALSPGCPAAQEDQVFENALVTACGFWLIITLGWHLERALQEDRTWGIASVRQRILARLEAFATTATTFGQFPMLRSTAERLRSRLDQRWPEIPPLPLYPAFQGE